MCEGDAGANISESAAEKLQVSAVCVRASALGEPLQNPQTTAGKILPVQYYILLKSEHA